MSAASRARRTSLPKWCIGEAIQEKTPVNSTPATIALPADARLLAVEVLLADPEALGNDALEGDLYILRDQLRGNQTDKPVSR
jgi:hypothetical protein